MGAVYLCPPPVLKASSGSCMQTMFLDQTFSGSHEHEKEDEEIAKPMDQVSGMFGLLLQRWHMQEQKLKQFTYTLASYQKTDAICPLENLNDDLESDVLVELEEGENRSLRNNESQDLEVTTGKLLHCSNYGKIPIQNADANEEKIEVQGRGHLKKLVSLEEKVETQRKRHLKNCASNNDEMRSAEDMADNTYKRQFQKQSIDDQGCPTQDLPKHDTLIGLNKERRDLVRSFRKLDLARIKRKELLWCRSMEETNKQLRMLATRQQRKKQPAIGFLGSKQYLETEQLNALQALEEEKEARLWMINLERLEEEKDLQYFGDLARRDLNMYLIKARTTEVCGTVNQLDLSSSPPISQLESKQKLLEGVKEIRSFTHHVSFNITSEYEYSDDQPSSQKFKNLSVLQEPVEDALPGHNIKEVLSVVHSLQKRQAETHETMGKEMPCEEYFSEDYVSHDCRKKTLHFQVNKVEVSTYRCYAHIPFTFVEKQKLKTGVQQGIFPNLMQVLVSVFLDMTRTGIPQKTLSALEVIPNHSGVCLCIMKFDQPGSTSGDQSNIPTFHCCSTNGKMRSSPHTGDAQFQSYGRILDSICTWISV